MIRAFALLLACIVFGFLAGAFALYGGTGGLAAFVVCLLLAVVFGFLAFRATSPPS